MATESYGRTDDGIAWVVHHQRGGPWWWTMTLPDGQLLQSTYLFDTEQQALEAVEDARLQAVAVRSASETEGLRTRAEAAEARAAQAEAAGYRRAVDDACAELGKRAGYLRNFDLAVDIVRALAPVEPVSPADGLPGGAA